MTDFDTMISVFDEAVNSDDPRVRNALNSLVMLVALTRDHDIPPDTKRRVGPFGELQQELHKLKIRLRDLERHHSATSTPTGPVDWGKIYKQKIDSKMRGRSINHVWLDESATLPSDLFEETK